MSYTANLSVNAQDFSDPVVYNNYLIKEQTKIIKLSLEYLNYSIQSDDYDGIDKKRLEFLSEIRRSMNKVRRLPNFQGTARLKRQTIEVFEEYISVYETDLIESLGLKKQFDDSYQALEAYLEAESEVDDKLNRAIDKLYKAQEAFARKYDLKLDEYDEVDLSDEIDQISELSKYSRAVFLEYFKVSWEFNELLKLLPDQNHRKLEKQRLKVIEACNTGLKNLGQIEPYRAESEYRQLTMDLIQYFRTLSRKEFATISAIYKKDEFTEDDAEFINKVIQDYNANIRNLVLSWTLANQYLWKENIN